MLTYTFNNKGNSTLYEFLYKSIKNDILTKTIKSGEKLPSKRSLATHLNISIVTVQNAYEQLIVEGYVYAIEKKGYFVSQIQADPAIQSIKIRQTTQISAPNTSIFMDLKSNTIHAEKFPFSIWSKLMREVLLENQSELLQQMPYNGILKLRIAIGEYVHHFKNIEVSPDQIIIGAGTEYLCNLLTQLMGRENVFAIENPGYQKTHQIYSAAGACFKYINLDQHGLSLMELENSNANIVHVSPSHHFPTGIVMPIKRRQELLNWANKQDKRYIIEDDYDSEFRYRGKPIQTLHSIDKNEKVIYISTFSKSIAPTIRISYMILPFTLMQCFHKKMSFYSCTVSSFEQYTLAKFIKNGYFDRHINRMRNFYKTQRNMMITLIRKNNLHGHFKIQEADAGTHFILKVDTKLSDTEIVDAALEKGIKISCLSEYYYGNTPAMKGYVLINYSSADSKLLPEAIHRLLSVFEPSLLK